MAEFGYSWAPEEGKKNARAQGIDLEASYKDLSQVCGAIKRRHADVAVELLEKASIMEIPILFKRFNKRLGHRHELGGKKGRYPKKAARLVLKVLQNAMANASFKGLGEPLVVTHACANKMNSMPRMQSKGKKIRSDYATAKVEIILTEAHGAKPVAKKEAKKEKKEKIKAEEKKEPVKALV